ETASAKTSRQRQGRIVRNILEQTVSHDLDFGRLSVDVDFDAVGAAGTIIGDAQVEPLIAWKLLGRAHLDGVARPKVDERKAGSAAFENELIPVIARIRAGL